MMANGVVNWTVDQLLSGIRTLDARAEHARNTISANRSRYMDTLRSLPSVPDLEAREAIRARLRELIHKQVEIENRYTELAALWTRAKGMVKNFLQSIGITPPSYLGGVVLAPAAVWGIVAAGLALVATVIAMAASQSKALECASNVTQAAAQRGWTAAQTSQALRDCKAAVDATRPDPLGLAETLKAALPLVLVVGALLVLAPVLQRKPGAA